MADSRTLRSQGAARLGVDLRWVFRLLSLATLVALAFPLSVSGGWIRVYTVDIVLVPLVALVASVRMARRVPRPKWHAAEIGAGAAVLLMCSSVILSVQPVTSFALWSVWIRAAALYIALSNLLVWGVVDSEDVMNGLETVLWIVAAVGLVQMVTGTDFGLISNYFGSGEAQGSSYQGMRRLSGTTPEANVYAQWLVMFSIPVIARLLFTARRLLLMKVGLVFAVVATLVGATLSRGTLAMLLLGVLALVAVWIHRARPHGAIVRVLAVALIGIGLAAWAFVAAAGGGTLSQITNRFAAQDAVRVVQILHGFELLSEPKVLMAGTGLGSFYPALDAYGIPVTALERWHFASATTGIHNGYLLLLTEAGLPVAFLMTWLTLDTVRRALRAPSGSGAGRWIPISLAVALSLYAGLAMMLYLSAVRYPNLLYFAVFVALVHRGHEASWFGAHAVG